MVAILVCGTGNGLALLLSFNSYGQRNTFVCALTILVGIDGEEQIGTFVGFYIFVAFSSIVTYAEFHAERFRLADMIDGLMVFATIKNLDVAIHFFDALGRESQVWPVFAAVLVSV